MSEEREQYEQPHPGETGHEESTGSDLPVEPESGDSDEGGPGEDSGQADQESKHSHPTSDPPANY